MILLCQGDSNAMFPTDRSHLTSEGVIVPDFLERSELCTEFCHINYLAATIYIETPVRTHDDFG